MLELIEFIFLISLLFMIITLLLLKNPKTSQSTSKLLSKVNFSLIGFIIVFSLTIIIPLIILIYLI
jgi:hypothetical protein